MIYKITPDGLVQRLLNRLYRIQLGIEEYFKGSPICLTQGIRVLLEDDYGIGERYDISYIGNRLILLRKNPDLCNNLTWFSLISGDIEAYRVIRSIIKDILVLRKKEI